MLALYCVRRYSFSYSVIFLLVDVFLWCLEVCKNLIVWNLNKMLWIITRWLIKLPLLSITLESIGFFKAYNIIVKWEDNVILNAESLTLKLEFSEWRCMSLTLEVKNLCKVAEALEALFSFTLYWRIFPLHSTSTGLGNNSEIQHYVKPKVTRLQATNGRIILKSRKNGQTTECSPKIEIKIKAAEAVFTSGQDIFIVNGRANKVTCDIKKIKKALSNRKNHLIEMACLRLKLAFPETSEPHQISVRCQSTRVCISRENLKIVLWTLNEFKGVALGNTDTDQTTSAQEISPSSQNNQQLSMVKVFADDVVLSLGTAQVPEIAAIKVFLDITANNWIGKSNVSGAVGLQGICISSLDAVDPCIIIGNDLITASWRCSFNTIHVYKRCLIFNAESKEILSVIVRPDYYEALLLLGQEYSFVTKNKDKASLSHLGESVKIAAKEYCPQTQISFNLEGLNLCLELDVFEKLASCTLEDIRFQCTRDSDNINCDFTVKVIEVEDRVNDEIALRSPSTDESQRNKSIHLSIMQHAINDMKSISFQEFYVEVADVLFSVEEELLLKLLVFSRVTKNQLWGDEPMKSDSKGLNSVSEEIDSPSIDSSVSLFFEKLEVTTFNVICRLTPKQELTDELVKLKKDLGIPNGLPPSVENAKLDFERLLRKGIYYRSVDALARDLNRHYLKEIGRQSAKILGSLHLLGNVNELKVSIAEGLAELRETGDYLGFAGHVRNGLAESYYKIADSWSAYVRTPTKTRTSPKVPSEQESMLDETKEEKVENQPRLLSSLSGWVFSTPTSESVYQEVTPSSSPVLPTEDSSVVYHSERDRSLCYCHGREDDAQSFLSMSSITSPSCWDDVPQQTQKQIKGQEFLRRLKQSMDDSQTEEKFICCLKLRYSNPKDKLNAMVTSRRVYLMRVGQPSIDNVVLNVSLEKLFEAKEKEDGDVKYLELVMRIEGMQRLSLPSPNPEDSPLVRCDTIQLAAKAAQRINRAKKMYYPSDYCHCSALLNGENL